MRLARHGSPGTERPIAAGTDGVWHDLTPLTADITPDFLATGLSGVAEALPTLPPAGPAERYGPPVSGLGKIVCIGLNYRDHAAETGADLPTEPILFLKTPDTVVGPDDEVLIPRKST
jgi:2-keto-4-pentenoate hydratase/2-oxohepta-3-ene-1,7-dioic acid hydratase in catechol pathway